jgi:CRISPR-associated protein Cas2
MLYLLAYDISNPKRLSKVAKLLEDFGTRVQYSLFECRLEPDAFHLLWEELCGMIDESEDRLVAYRLDHKNARQTLTAGRMVCSSTHVCYLV